MKRRAALAFTLVELVVVLGIVGLLVGFGLPGFMNYTKQVRLKSATRQVVGLVSLTRSRAIGSRDDHAVVVNVASQRLSAVNLASGETLEQVVTLPPSVTVEMRVGGEVPTETQFVFRPTGGLAGRTVVLVLSNGEREQSVTVTGTTGAVVVQ
jgi:Tfp pilus assembly protein FimT